VQEPLTSLEDDVAATERINRSAEWSVHPGYSQLWRLGRHGGRHPLQCRRSRLCCFARGPILGRTKEASEGACQVSRKNRTGDQADYRSLYFPRSRTLLRRLRRGPAAQASRIRIQIPTAAKVFSTPMTAAAWKAKPSSAIVAAKDRIINPDLERMYYARVHSHTIELRGASHSVCQSPPREVAGLIEQAAQHSMDQQESSASRPDIEENHNDRSKARLSLKRRVD
jgi:hypothetical protein